MSNIYVLVHGAWHTGTLLEPTAEHMRKLGHTVHCPTLKGNRPGDDRSQIGLEDAAQSVCDYLRKHDLKNVRLVGHSYGGMIISRVADVMPERIARLVYVNAFVPNPGECLNDMVPPHYKALFDTVAAASNNAVMLPFPIWREAFINDADLALAQSAFDQLNLQPYKTFTDPISLKAPLAALEIGKSYVNCQQDAAMPHSMPWHPRLSERLGLFRLVECQGSHEIWFTDPATIADAVIRAGRD
ncbi:alpha/beta hydrolase [Limnohabitans sp. Rim8]|jgi:pimeloyl-ACP methyl ester carboxylesterase|uniref:alpha/beta hydrolase n=1 Tax=Limnohabitans sp. Rim8 TaxID=1100718 RepID=UPI0025CBAD86|nr:alpha/beta hydrolase [Limnohabitans sp. Rim8]